MTMTRRVFALALATVMLSAGPVLAAKADHSQEKAELRDKFRARYPALKRLKLDGFVGETAEGMVAAVNNQPLDAAAASLVSEENRDRQRLYEILAEELGTDVNTVARQNAQRNFEKADAGEYLRDSAGRWTKKG